ncbi:hypothetical protein [Nocardia nova]
MVFELGSQTLTLHRRVPQVDGNGRPVLDAYGRKQVTVVDDVVTGCDWEVTESVEDESAVTIVRLDGRGMLPPGTAVAYTDAVTWNGIKFELHGPARPVPDIDGAGIDHIAVTGRSSLDSNNPDSREEG